MTLYHVTNVRYLKSIFEKGLIPCNDGPLSDLVPERWEAVFMFKELDENFQRDIDSWLILHHAKKNMALLKVTLPEDFGGLSERFDWEVLCTKPIPPEYIEQIPYTF